MSRRCHAWAWEIGGAVGAVLAVSAFGVALLAGGTRRLRRGLRYFRPRVPSAPRWPPNRAWNCPGLTPADGSNAQTSSASAKRKDHPGVVYRNVGTTTAHAVTGVLTINNQRFDLTFGDVEPNGLIEHEASDLFHHAAEQDEVNIRDASSAGIALVSGPSFKVTKRLSWRSELGTPSIWTL